MTLRKKEFLTNGRRTRLVLIFIPLGWTTEWYPGQFSCALWRFSNHKKEKKWKGYHYKPFVCPRNERGTGRASLGIRSNSFNIPVKLRWIVFLRKLTKYVADSFLQLKSCALVCISYRSKLKKLRLKFFNLGSRF